MMKKFQLLFLVLLVIFYSGCTQSQKSKVTIVKDLFGVHDGKEVHLLTLTNKEGNIIKLTNYGARITWIEVPDKNGVRDNVTFGYDTFDETINGDKTFGSTIGRYANRIAKGKFTIDGKVIEMIPGNERTVSHGGRVGWQGVVWDTEVLTGSKNPSVKFSYVSADMEAGFPGTMNVEVVYTWTDKNEIIMDYKCTTDKKTVLNITNHAYFNLHGAGNGDVLDHILTLKASSYTPWDSIMIPTGEILPVKGTPFDFTTPHTIGERINEDNIQLKIGNGYDHNYVLDNKEEVDAIVYEPVSGRMLEVITDQPGIHLYTGNWLNGKRIGHGGKAYHRRSAICLEAHHYPDSPNHPNFPSTLLSPGETFKSTTIYRFSVK
jgi:aldose 1-epimerase